MVHLLRQSPASISTGAALKVIHFLWLLIPLFILKVLLARFDWTQWDYNRVNRSWVCPLITMWTPPGSHCFQAFHKDYLLLLQNCSIVSSRAWAPHERWIADGTIEEATVARGGCICTNESIGATFKNRSAGSSHIQLLNPSDWMCSFIYQPVRKNILKNLTIPKIVWYGYMVCFHIHHSYAQDVFCKAHFLV